MPESVGCGGCLLSVAGLLTALFVWGGSRRTHVHMGGGFENQGMDLSVLWTELPLVLAAGALIPATVWLTVGRLLRGRGPRAARLLVPTAVTIGALVLSAWALHTWVNPPRPPSPDVRLSDDRRLSDDVRLSDLHL
ncbi:hypothetical protein [Streptomyces sp. NBC_00286]|uniref:hypothetical protein n=1 Tax=Streptomyces sp. NBC_00286 TaxID=2975701 RepID=UPI002E2A43CA|nr:hypothetical protein [Streptomyces sp. NBC_00286]